MEFDIYVDAAHPTATDATKIKIMLNPAGREAIEPPSLQPTLTC